MTYSNTVGKTQVNVAQMIEYAFREAGKTAEEQTPEYINAAKQALFYILQSLSNRGVDLWAVNTIMVGALQAQTVIDMPAGTVEVLEANWRYIQTPQASGYLPTDNVTSPAAFDYSLATHATSTVGENWFGAYFQGGQIITQVGFNAYVVGGGTTTYNFVYETSTDGINWTTAQTLPATTLSDKGWAYFQIDLTPSQTYVRLRETVNPTFSVRQIAFSYVQQDIPLARLNRDTYFALPNKQFQSQRSLQYWYNKGVTQSLNLWPIPNNDFQCFQFVLETQLQDVGALGNQLYVPNRWMNGIQSMLSHRMAMQLPGVDLQRITYLDQMAQRNLLDAENSEEDKAPIYFQPNISYYTR